MENTTNTGKKGFLQNDRLLVCSMLVFYGLCLIGLTTVTFRWLNNRNQMLSAHTTATGVVIATQHANATASAVIHATKLAQYETIDHFDTNINHWRIGPEDSDYWTGSIQITSGYYVWKVWDVKKKFCSMV